MNGSVPVLIVETSYHWADDVDDVLTACTASLCDTETEDFDVTSGWQPLNNNRRLISGGRSEASYSTRHCDTYIQTTRGFYLRNAMPACISYGPVFASVWMFCQNINLAGLWQTLIRINKLHHCWSIKLTCNGRYTNQPPLSTAKTVDFDMCSRWQPGNVSGRQISGGRSKARCDPI